MEKFFDINGITLCIDDTCDETKPPILLFHGLTGSKEGMFNIRDMLKDEYRVICVDTRGHGASTHPAHYTLADHAADAHALIAALGFEKANILGYSMGSYIALATAEMRSDDIDHLILVCTKPSGTISSTARLLKEAGYDITTVTPEQMSKVTMKAAFAPSSLERLTRGELKIDFATASGAVELTPEEKTAEDASIAGFDNSRDYDKVTCKTLVIGAEYDGINPPELGKEVADGIQGAEFVLIKDAGHIAAYEQPEEFKRVIKDFLKK